MKKIKHTPQFKKDGKKVEQYKNFDPNTLDYYVNLLADGRRLPEKCRDHKLSKSSPKEYRGLRDFHLTPDICVIYDITETTVTLHRIGKHNNLNLTEELVEKLILSI